MTGRPEGMMDKDLDMTLRGKSGGSPVSKGKLSDKKACKLAKDEDIDALAALAIDAQFICKKCGRVSSNKKNLCKAQKL